MAAQTTFATGACEGAARTGVHGHLVLGLIIDTLDDIDFTTVRPGRLDQYRESRETGTGLLTNWDRSSSCNSPISMSAVDLDEEYSQCRPHATSTVRHMSEIKDNQAVSVLCLACQTDAVAPSSRSDIDVIDAPGHLAVADVVQILGVGSGLVNIVDITMSRVIELVPLLSMHADQSGRTNVRYRR
ncbi:MAG: hypothetical protein L6R38_005942 [Xanthoria sp. 2 TBL-2021]|nr:MAG: hypothetical protein L6R38_005942 [Xanthoria sp. 2 TBL-2021]